MRKIIKINKRPASLDSTLKQQVKRVVAYARVSTDSTEQMHSIAAQKDYYLNLIQNTPDWIFAGLYSDEGISGLIREKRSGFNRMMDDAEKGVFENFLLTLIQTHVTLRWSQKVSNLKPWSQMKKRHPAIAA